MADHVEGLANPFAIDCNFPGTYLTLACLSSLYPLIVYHVSILNLVSTNN